MDLNDRFENLEEILAGQRCLAHHAVIAQVGDRPEKGALADRKGNRHFNGSPLGIPPFFFHYSIRSDVPAYDNLSIRAWDASFRGFCRRIPRLPYGPSREVLGQRS
jgi:hypothetical protein